MAIRELVELASRVAELERRFSGMMRSGAVEEVDPKKQVVRLNFGQSEDGLPFLSPWIPYAQIAGALKIHTPPSKGQQFTMLAPSGDWQQAVALPLTWSDQNASPSDKGDEHVLTFGEVSITITGGGVTLKAPKIVLDAACHIGGEGGKPASREGTIDSCGCADSQNFATRVWLK